MRSSDSKLSALLAICSLLHLAAADSQTDPAAAHKVWTYPPIQKVKASTLAAVMCVANDIPHPKITWTLDGQPFKAPSYEVDPTEAVSFVRTSKAGTYTCTATGGQPPQQDSATAQILSYPEGKEPAGFPVISPLPSHVHVHEGEDVVLDCLVQSNPPTKIHYWLFNGFPINPRPHLQNPGVLQNGSLILTKATPTFSGVYECVATNTLGSAYSNPATIKITSQRTIDDGLRALMADLLLLKHMPMFVVEEEVDTNAGTLEIQPVWAMAALTTGLVFVMGSLLLLWRANSRALRDVVGIIHAKNQGFQKI